MKRILSLVLSCALLLCCLISCIVVRADASTFPVYNYGGLFAPSLPSYDVYTYKYAIISVHLGYSNLYVSDYPFLHDSSGGWESSNPSSATILFSKITMMPGWTYEGAQWTEISLYPGAGAADPIWTNADMYADSGELYLSSVVPEYKYDYDGSSQEGSDSSGDDSSDYDGARYIWVSHDEKPAYYLNSTLQFYANWDYTGDGNFNKDVIWATSGSDAATYIDSSGLLTIGPNETETYITVTAFSAENFDINGTSTIPVTPLLAPDFGGDLEPDVTIPSNGDGYTGEGAPSESRIPVVTATSPQSLVYALGDEPAYMTIETSCGDIGEIEYQWYCLYTDSAGEQQTLVGSKSYNQKPVTSIPGLYEYFLVVTNTVDGEVYYGNSPTFTVNVYVPEHETDIGKLLDRIIENQVTIDGHIDDLESILQSTNENLFDSEKGFLPKILDAIKALFTGGDSQEDEQFREDAEQNRQEFEDSMDEMNSMTKPNYEDMDAGFDDILDNDNADDGIGLASQFFETIFSNDIIFTVFFIAFMLALVSYVIFGKR